MFTDKSNTNNNYNKKKLIFLLYTNNAQYSIKTFVNKKNNYSYKRNQFIKMSYFN